MIKKLFIFFLFFQIASCAVVFNKRDTEATFKSYPDKADVRINGELFGQTPVTVSLHGKPRSYVDVLYSKKGYANREFKIYSRPRGGLSCTLDAMGSFLIIPIFSVVSEKCQTFEGLYFKSLDEGTRNNIVIQDN